MIIKLEHEVTIAHLTRQFILSRMLNVPNLIEMALHDKEVEQVSLREAIRISYYVVFQTICRICTEALSESKAEDIKSEDWLKIFRSFDHKDLRNKLKAIDQDQTKVKKYPYEIKKIAKNFSKLQDERMKADYDPSPFLIGYDEAIKLIKNTVLAAFELEKLSLSDKRSLAITLLFKDRP
jgi:hypothetical protein